MKELNPESVKEFAWRQGLDLVGVANIERFEGAPPRMHPARIMPAARSVIVVARRILRGNWRGIEEGTYWPTYTYFGYHGLLNSFFLTRPVYETACFIEDFGWEAVPYYPGVPEGQPPPAPVRPGEVAPDVHLAIRIAGIAAGLGEIGWSKVFLTRTFGPRVRLHAIITDAPLAPDPLVEPGSLCDRCMACAQGCPCDAIPRVRDGKTVSIRIEDKTYTWGDVHMGRCTLSYHGGDPRVSPFIHKTFSGYEFDVTRQERQRGHGVQDLLAVLAGALARDPRRPVRVRGGRPRHGAALGRRRQLRHRRLARLYAKLLRSSREEGNDRTDLSQWRICQEAALAPSGADANAVDPSSLAGPRARPAWSAANAKDEQLIS